MEAAEATQRGVTMQTRPPVCAVSPETHRPLRPQQSRCGEQERDCPRGEVGSSGVWGAAGGRGAVLFSELWRERLGQWCIFGAGRIQLLHVEGSISNNSN